LVPAETSIKCDGYVALRLVGQRLERFPRSFQKAREKWKKPCAQAASAATCCFHRPQSSDPLTATTAQEILKLLPRVTLDGVEFVVIEGDILVKEPEAMSRLQGNRFTAAQVGFFILSQSGERPER
jgi:hypothetical protein